MSGFSPKITRNAKKARKTESEETNIKPDADMTQILELSDGKFKLILINMLSMK